MPTSAIGFGYHAFGRNPFGYGNWARRTHFESFPTWVRVEDGLVQEPIAKPLERLSATAEKSLNLAKREIIDFTSLSDADRTKLKNLSALAYNYGIPSSSEDKDEAFRRSEILNQHLLIKLKGHVKGYEIIAAFWGLTVEVFHLWALDCCDPDSLFVTEPPSSFIARFDETPCDEVPLDRFYTTRIAIWPRRVHPFGTRGTVHFDEIPADEIPLDLDGNILPLQCPSHTLDLIFSNPDDTEIEDYTGISRSLVRELERMRPIHVEFRRVVFDGPKASAYWNMVIEADAEAATYWTTPITALDDASAYWTTNIDSSLVV